MATASASSSGSFSEDVIELQHKLAPCFIQNARHGIETRLNRMLLRFNPVFGGVPLSYRDLRLVDETAGGRILFEQPHVLCKVQAKFLVFKAKPGTTLTGKVNKIESSHVGLLVNGVFNASVPEVEMPKGYRHDAVRTCWTRKGKTLLSPSSSSSSSSSSSALPQDILLGDEVEFHLLKVDTQGSIISLQGSLRKRSANSKKRRREEAADVEADETATAAAATPAGGSEDGAAADEASAATTKKAEKAEKKKRKAAKKAKKEAKKAKKEAKKAKKSKKEVLAQ